MNKHKITFAVFISLVFLSACTVTKNIYIQPEDIRLYEIPGDWRTEGAKEKTIARNAKYLKGRKIFIDPGHGGRDRRNKSKSGKVVEADVNLRVALYLKEYLEKAGAVVVMSRVKDNTVELLDRPELANNSGAEIFISIHHNASPTLDNNWSNYTSTFYHAKEGNPEYKEASRDIAKFVQRELAYAMRNSGGLGTFDGTYSDYRIYPDEGFAVLRLTEMPAILVECSFFNHVNEEKRLQIDEFNQIQAWGIFKGIGRYYFNGLPQVSLLQKESQYNNGKLSLVFEITDITRINWSTVKIKMDGKEVDHFVDKGISQVRVLIEDLESGDHEVSVDVENKNGNNNFPFSKTIKIK